MFLLVSALGVCACESGRGVFKLCMHLILFFWFPCNHAKLNAILMLAQKKTNCALTALQSVSGFPGQ